MSPCGHLSGILNLTKSEPLISPVLFQTIFPFQLSTSHLMVTQSFPFLMLKSLCPPLTPPFPTKASSVPSTNPICSSLKRNTEFYNVSQTQQALCWPRHHVLSLVIEIGSQLIFWLLPWPLESIHSTTVSVILLKCKSWPVTPPVSACLRVKDRFSTVTPQNARMCVLCASVSVWSSLVLFFLVWLQ